MEHNGLDLCCLGHQLPDAGSPVFPGKSPSPAQPIRGSRQKRQAGKSKGDPDAGQVLCKEERREMPSAKAFCGGVLGVTDSKRSFSGWDF